MTVKFVYLAKRHPDLTREQFRMRWRQHGALAISQDSWKRTVCRYIHSDPLPYAHGLLGATDEYDGVGMIFSVDLATRRLRITDRPESEKPIAAKDEAETFGARVGTHSFSVAERILRDGPVTGAKCFRFLWRRNGIGPDTFRARWDIHASLLLGTPSLSRYVQRYSQGDVIEPGLLDPGRTAWGLTCEGVEETWFPTLESLLGLHAEPAFAALVERDRAEFVERSLLILAVDTVLYDTRDATAIDGTAR